MNIFLKVILCLAISILYTHPLHSYAKDFTIDRPITIAILAKDMAHCLPLYLTCIEKQTWPKSKTYLYIRTNDNNDNTATNIKDWIEKVKDQYLGIYFDDSDVPISVKAI